MSIEVTLAKAAVAAEGGEYWRSREILSSSLSSFAYDRRLLSALSDISFKMGNELEAGRWLLTFVDEPDDKQRSALDLFVGRHRSGGFRSLLSQLPAGTRPDTLEDSPAYLRSVLVELDAPKVLRRHEPTEGSAMPGLLALLGCVLVAGAMAMCCLVGMVTIFSWFAR
ncbi:hypothetical protein [Neorhodopirellula lusitana]|uniref:hypothetical protein n=1 Tax=Neorhodopirellula lusitana TaxID=445327 RepID=UPI0038513124